MIRLGTIAPDKLNLNGDQGNLLALSKFLRLAGFEVEVLPVSNFDQALACNFLILGHGSIAAMQSLDATFERLNLGVAVGTVPGLAIGSGFEYLSRVGLVDQKIQPRPRQSEFAIGQIGPVKALGYRNTDSGLPNLALNGQWICSMLHGPLFAKNPILLMRAAKATVAAAQMPWPTELPVSLLQWIDDLNEICSRIWKLETEATFEPLIP